MTARTSPASGRSTGACAGHWPRGRTRSTCTARSRPSRWHRRSAFLRRRWWSRRSADFSGHYPDDASRESARRYFGIGAEAPVFVTLGAARAYKGLDLLLRAFAGVRERVPEARLIVAGRTGLPAGSGRFVEPAPGVILMPNFIDDTTVQYVLRAADYAVFSFRRVMVSSSVLLAETFGLPVIVPDLPTLREMVEPGRNGFVYPAGDAEALARLMLGAAALPRESRDALAAGALDDIRRRDWSRYTDALVRAACGADERAAA